MSLQAFVNQKIGERKAKNEIRTLMVTDRADFPAVMRGDKRLISFACNDYLGLSTHPEVKAAAAEAAGRYGAGAGASRLVTGSHPLYAALEDALARHKGTEAALVFGSGYLANLGVVSALMGEGDLIVADKLAHACMIDGARLSGARLVRFAHNDVSHAAKLLDQHRAAHRHCLILTEGVFSMDGDVGDVDGLSALAKRYDAWLMVDDAHALGTLNDGKGSAPDVAVDIRMGTLSKALGAAGGYICASRAVVDYLVTDCRPQLFTTGLPPATVAGALKALEIMQAEPQRRERVLTLARRFTDAVGLPRAVSPIVPLLVGESEQALQATAVFEAEGMLVPAIRPPTVPPGTARLRFSFSAAHSDDQVDAVAGVAKRVVRG